MRALVAVRRRGGERAQSQLFERLEFFVHAQQTGNGWRREKKEKECGNARAAECCMRAIAHSQPPRTLFRRSAASAVAPRAWVFPTFAAARVESRASCCVRDSLAE